MNYQNMKKSELWTIVKQFPAHGLAWRSKKNDMVEFLSRNQQVEQVEEVEEVEEKIEEQIEQVEEKIEEQIEEPEQIQEIKNNITQDILPMEFDSLHKSNFDLGNSLNNKIKIYIKQESRLNAFVEYTVGEFLSDGISGHEGIFGSCKDYAEFDKSFNNSLDLDTFIKANQAEIIQEYAEASGVPIDELTIMTAHGQSKGKFKFSLHIVGTSKYASGLEVKNKLKKFKWTIEPDWGVYKSRGKRQLMRCVGTSKVGEDRPLILIQGTAENSFISLREEVEPEVGVEQAEVEPEDGVEQDPKISNACELFKNTEDGKNHILREYRESGGKFVITMNRNNPSNCEFCEREHTSDNTIYIIVYQDGGIFYGCNKSRAPMICLKTVKLSAKDRIINDIIATPNRTECDERVALELNPIIVNERWVSNVDAIRNDVMNFSGVIGVRAPMGTGKTYSNVRDIEEYLKLNPDARILVISMRVSLANKYKNEYVGFQSYLDKKGEIRKKRVIVQLDSLGRIKWEGGELVDIVVIDEATQAVKHLTSKTYINQPNAYDNIRKFKALLKFAKKVILLDANLDKFTMDFIQSLRNDEIEPRIYWNKYQSQQTTFKFTEKKNDIYDQVSEGLRADKKAFIAMNYSNENILALGQKIQSDFPDKKILVVCMETIGSDEVNHALNHPECWADYDVFITSPSIQGGVSCDEVNAFDNIYGLFCSASCGPDDASQMLGRVRHPRSRIIHVHIKQMTTPVFETPRDYMNYLLANREHTLFGPCVKMGGIDYEYNKYGKIEFKNNWFGKFIASVKSRESKLKSNWRREFMRIQSCKGHINEFRASGMSKEEVKADNKKTRKAKFEVDEIKTSDIFNAPDITDDEYKILKDKQVQTPEENSKIQRRYLREHYRKHGELPREFVSMYNDKDVMKTYSNRVMFTNEHNRSIEENLEELKKKEILQDIKNNRSRGEVEGHRSRTADGVAMLKSIGFKYRYMAFNLILGWLMALGFESIDDDRFISSEDIKIRLVKIIENMDFDKVAKILGKRKQRMKTIRNLKHTDKKFIKYGLGFINAGLSKFGISVNSLGMEGEAYGICDKYLLFFKRAGSDGQGYELIQDRAKYTSDKIEIKEIVPPTTEEIEAAMRRLGIEF